MDERVIQFRVGVVVVAAATITIILIMLFGAGPKLLHDQYTIYIGFPEAPGVAVDTPVRKSGVLIGRVSDVRLLEEGGVVLTLKIDSRYRLRHHEIARIGTGSLVTGDAVIEFVPSGKPGASTEPIEDGEYLANGVVAGDPLQVFVDLEEKMSTAISSIESAGDEVTVMARSLTTVIANNEDQIQRIMQKSEQALDRFDVAMGAIDELVSDPELRENLKRSLESVPELMEDAQETLATARDTLNTFQRVSERAESNLENLENLTRPLGERGEQIAETIDQSTRNLNELLGQLAQFSQSVNSRDGTLGQLIHDRELYERLNMAARNVEEASRRLRPILDDVRVFTDKIATDPRQLGIKGALDRRPVGVGLKNSLQRR